jgi:hypothetical protein
MKRFYAFLVLCAIMFVGCTSLGEAAYIFSGIK